MDQSEKLLPPPDEKLIPEHAGEMFQSDINTQTMLSWSAPGRPFQKRSKEFFLNILIILLLVEVILFLFSQYLLMVLIATLAFLAYALNSIPPHDFHYKVTTEGIMVQDHFFLWQELYDFYFKKQGGIDVLMVGTKQWYPGELTIVLGDMHKDHVRDILLPFLPYREYIKPTFIENASNWLEKNFPLDRKRTTI